jgi:peptidoglycan/xylan/chitin deacetylase (PgdA/CDA1 family)
MRVALTFDVEHPDRPCRPGGAMAMVEAVARADAPATGFLQGRWVLAEPDVARSLAAAGWLVGSHSHHHAPFPSLTPAGRRADLEDATAAITETCRVDPRPWFRLPFGRGQGDPRITRELRALGFQPPVGWDVDPDDWSGIPGERIRTMVRDGLARRAADAVVLLHSWPDGTRDAIAGIVRDIRDAGHDLVRLDQLTGP